MTRVWSLRTRARPIALGLLALVIVLLLAQARSAAFLTLTLEERLERVVDLFVAEVVAVRSERRGDDPWTVVELRVDHWLVRDGELVERGPDIVQLAFLGGEAAGAAPRQVALFPRFAPGEQHLVASYGAESRAASPLVGVTQGLWTRHDDDAWRDATGAALALDSAGQPLLNDTGVSLDAWLPALRASLPRLRGTP